MPGPGWEDIASLVPAKIWTFACGCAISGGLRISRKRCTATGFGTGPLPFENSAETNRGYAFAVACAKARERGIAEPDLEQFREAWLRQPIYARAVQMAATVGESLYRLSIICRAEGRSFVSRVYLAAAAMCPRRGALSRLGTRSTKDASQRSSAHQEKEDRRPVRANKGSAQSE